MKYTNSVLTSLKLCQLYIYRIQDLYSFIPLNYWSLSMSIVKQLLGTGRIIFTMHTCLHKWPFLVLCAAAEVHFTILSAKGWHFYYLVEDNMQHISHCLFCMCMYTHAWTWITSILFSFTTKHFKCHGWLMHNLLSTNRCDVTFS